MKPFRHNEIILWEIQIEFCIRVSFGSNMLALGSICFANFDVQASILIAVDLKIYNSFCRQL